MHNAQALDKYVGSVSAGAAVCTGFVKLAVATPGHDHKPTTMYRVLNKFASSWRAVATIQTSVLLLPAQGLMLHAQVGAALVVLHVQGLCNVCICIQPTTHCMVCRTHPSEVMGMEVV
jgi:hypothetical protein